jgi:hypothetical protein
MSVNPTPRYRYGDANPVTAQVASSGQQIDIGDLVSYESQTLKRAEDETWTGTLSGTQQNFVASFLGVAAQRKVSTASTVGTGSGGPIGPGFALTQLGVRVDTTGTFEFKCASASFNIGDLVGPAKDTGNNLLSDTVVAVGAKNLAIGRVTEATNSQTTVKVRIFSTVMGVINN